MDIMLSQEEQITGMKQNWQMAEPLAVMLDQCRPEPLQMDRLIRRRQLKESDVLAVLQEK